MSWHDFVFSNQSRHRSRRHLVCWLLWWAYIIFFLFFTPSPVIRQRSVQIFERHQPGLKELGLLSYSSLILLKSFLLLSFHILFCYTIIYISFAFQGKGKYWILIPGILVISTLMIPVGYLLYSMVYPFIDKLFELRLTRPDKHIIWRGIDAGLINAIKVTLIAVAITLLKRWWVRQKEKEQLEKERINAEVQLLKAQIHPAFLFSTLNNITAQARLASPKAPEMLIKLSDLLSYMLYECDAEKVRLEKEIGMLREYMSLEKLRQGERLEMTFQIKGELNGQLISPLLLLPFIDNSFFYCNNEFIEQAWVNLEIIIEGNQLSMKLIYGIASGIEQETIVNQGNLTNVKKRLELLYPGGYDLKINAEEELIMVHLNLKLEEGSLKDQSEIEPAKTVLSHAGI